MSKIILFALLPTMAFHFGVRHLWHFADEEGLSGISEESKEEVSHGFVTLDDLDA